MKIIIRLIIFIDMIWNVNFSILNKDSLDYNNAYACIFSVANSMLKIDSELALRNYVAPQSLRYLLPGPLQKKCISLFFSGPFG